jgi:hypothetical protein
MTIRFRNKFENSKPAGFDGEFDWDFLLPAFKGTKIEPMDFDCVVERRGHFLIFETKSKNKEVPLGQQITLKNLVILGEGKVHVIILWGKTPNEVSSMEEWYYEDGRQKIFHRNNCSSDFILKLTTKWFSYINQEKKFSQLSLKIKK